MIFKKIKLIYLVLLVLATPFSSVFAENLSTECSQNGYTISTINGVFTDKKEAEDNQKWLKYYFEYYFGETYNGQKIDYQYLLNPSHVGRLGDLVKSVYQKYFDEVAVEDYDLVEMLKSASEKVRTQKLLFVAHSQGNFYANSFYDVVAGQPGGVPK